MNVPTKKTNIKKIIAKPANVPVSAMEAYKALQKCLNIRVAVANGETTQTMPEIVDFLKPEVGPLLRKAVELSFTEVAAAEKVSLKSKVDKKSYFAYRRVIGNETFLSRPINAALYCADLKPVEELCTLLESGLPLDDLRAAINKWPSDQLHRTLYSMAMAFCCAIDIQKSGDKKTPGTFFEYFVAYLFAQRLRVNPRRRVEVNSNGEKFSIPTDFIFDPGDQLHKFHVPVKTSTRERVIQVWAHQRVIDGTLGLGRYYGIPVVMNETKLDKRKLEVVEICLPDQWKIYQAHISQMKRVYYLDIPKPYETLNKGFFKIEVKPLAEFFFEADVLASAL